MKAKCAKGGCGYEFENQNEKTFFDTMDEGDIIFEISSDSCNAIGYVFCPICGARCIEVKK